MAIYKDAIYKPLTVSKGRQRMFAYNRMNLHVAVSEASSLYGAFNRKGQPDSHFYVRRGTPEQIAKRLPATIEQYVDTIYRANADLEGNDATISVETQGGVKNADSEPWDISQLLAMANLYAWSVQTHGIAEKIATSSQLGYPSKGLSWHRLGVDGNFPQLPNIGAGRNQRGGGMRYSKSRGKSCPGLAKIQQIPSIFATATVVVEVSSPVPPQPKPPVVVAPKPKPAPTPKPKPVTSRTLRVEGYWGSATTKDVQRILGTPVDGKVSGQPRVNKKHSPGLYDGWQWSLAKRPTGSLMIKALQRKLKADGFYKGAIDGWFGPANIAALQKALGTHVDGKVSKQSTMVKQLQANLNAGKLY